MIPRPTVTQEMKIEAARLLVAAVGWPADYAEDIANQFNGNMDGYELTKELERWCSWDVPRDMMEELDGMQYQVDKLLAAAEHKWFEENDIQPPHPIGTRIRDRRWKDGEVGCIDGIYEHGVAKYLMKPDGQDDEATGNQRLIIKFEDAELVA